MRVKLASDIHGAYDALAEALEPGDTAFLLGDFINVIDYKDQSGILAEIVPREIIRASVKLIGEQKLDEARALMSKTSKSIDNFFARVAELADKYYDELFSKLPCEAYIIHGNVDFPPLLAGRLRARQHYIAEQQAFDFDGRRCGFVSGHPKMTYSFGMPGEVTEDEFARRLALLGPVDHLFVHSPPAVRELSFDTAAGRDEGGSPSLLQYIVEHQPRTVHFGHVHVPIAKSLTIGETSCVNLGCFRDERKVTGFSW
ncbi:metallophosphoesterase [bacterium]|nr:metallophosphoesterase [bacterium]